MNAKDNRSVSASSNSTSIPDSQPRSIAEALCGASLSLKGSTLARLIAAYEGTATPEGKASRWDICEDELLHLDIACADVLRLLADASELANREGEFYTADALAMSNALHLVVDLMTFRRDVEAKAFTLSANKGRTAS